MSRKIRKLTPAILRKIVMQESLSGELGTSAALEKDIDHAKVLKLEERRLLKRLKRVKEARKLIHKRILKGL